MITQFSSLKKNEKNQQKRVKAIQDFESSPNSSSLGVTPKREDPSKKIKQFFNLQNETP